MIRKLERYNYFSWYLSINQIYPLSLFIYDCWKLEIFLNRAFLFRESYSQGYIIVLDGVLQWSVRHYYGPLLWYV